MVLLLSSTWAGAGVHEGQDRLLLLLRGAVKREDEDVFAVEGAK